MFYGKLALSNLKKNKRAYLPFLLSMIFLVAINTMVQLVVTNQGMKELPGAGEALQMFSLGQWVILFFSVLFALYTNSFLLKQRKKEFGLYNILGLGKRELFHLLFWESWAAFALVIVVGILLGLVLTRLNFLLLIRFMQLQTGFAFQVTPGDFGWIVLLFMVLFLLLFALNCIQMWRMNPIDLLQGSKNGEKMPKANWFMAVLGLVTLGGGYYISVTIQDPIDALLLFFVAVILVIIGTYCLFMAGSIALLQILKKRKGYYYQTKHFINVSSMIYRMKQNAAGLASICILSTMVLVTVATTASLYFGQQDILDYRYPTDIAIEMKEEPTELLTQVRQKSEAAGVTLRNEKQLITSDPILFLQKSNSKFQVAKQAMGSMKDAAMVTFTDLDNYQTLSGEKPTLAKGEVLVLTVSGPTPQKTLDLSGQEFSIKKNLTELPGYEDEWEGMVNVYLVVMPDWATIQSLLDDWFATAGPDFAKNRLPNYRVSFDFTAPKDQRLAFAHELETALTNMYGGFEEGFSVNSRDAFAENSKQITGGFFFLGILFGVTFTIATGMIIYYKQISEGLDDQERFAILQKVGMSHREVKSVIHAQVLMVFAFPLVVAIVHLAFAFPIIRNLLILFGLVNWQLFLLTTVVVVALFALLYFLIYQITAKSYYQIVER